MKPIGDMIDKVVKDRNLGNRGELQKKVLHDPDVNSFLKENSDKLNKAIVANSIMNLYEFYTQKNNPDKVMAGYQPELFLNGAVIDVRYKPTAEKIDQDHEKMTRKHLELIDLPKKLHDVHLSQLDMTQERSEAVELIGKFLSDYKNDVHQRGLYLSGNFGVGKTFLLAGLANAVASLGKQVVFLHVPTFISGLSSHFDDNSLQDEIHRVANCDLLILDDIGAETLSQWSRDDVLGVILQARMDNVLPTFFSSNLGMDDLEEHFKETKNSTDAVKAARLMQRVRFLAKEVVVSGKNRRIQE